MAIMSSRERMLAVLRREAPDHLPLFFNAFGFRPPAHLSWRNDIEQARAWLSVGVDAWLWTGPPLRFRDSITVRESTETPAGERWPVMVKVYDTPAGPFRQEVFRSEDWVSDAWPGHADGRGVSLFDDYNAVRNRRPPVIEEADVERLKHLLQPLDGADLAAYRDEVTALSAHARELGVLLVGQGSNGVDAAIQLCGANSVLQMAIDQPVLFEALLDTIDAWDRRNVEVLLDTSVDLIMRRGYYEGASFWSPDLWRRHFAPRLRALTEMVHAGGRYMGYTMSVGLAPLLEDLAAVGYDMHHLLDPLPNGRHLDLEGVKATLGRTASISGGINAPITLECGSGSEIRQEVRDAACVLGRGGGFALTAAEGIFSTTPWESIEHVLAAWREVREYRPAG
jgi:uroporphyrinogen-III decarboxylase